MLCKWDYWCIIHNKICTKGQTITIFSTNPKGKKSSHVVSSLSDTHLTPATLAPCLGAAPFGVRSTCHQSVHTTTLSSCTAHLCAGQLGAQMECERTAEVGCWWPFLPSWAVAQWLALGLMVVVQTNLDIGLHSSMFHKGLWSSFYQLTTVQYRRAMAQWTSFYFVCIHLTIK